MQKIILIIITIIIIIISRPPLYVLHKLCRSEHWCPSTGALCASPAFLSRRRMQTQSARIALCSARQCGKQKPVDTSGAERNLWRARKINAFRSIYRTCLSPCLEGIGALLTPRPMSPVSMWRRSSREWLAHSSLWAGHISNTKTVIKSYTDIDRAQHAK